jgi:hypothetical protein
LTIWFNLKLNICICRNKFKIKINLRSKVDMNFQSVLEELNSLYEEDLSKVEEVEIETEVEEIEEENSAKEPVAERLIEATEEPEADEEIEIVEDPATEEPPVEAGQEDVQLVLECANCGGLIIKQEAEAKVDEEADLVNIGETCQYCEETIGYKILGILNPYTNDDEEVFEEDSVAEEASEDTTEEPEEATAE